MVVEQSVIFAVMAGALADYCGTSKSLPDQHSLGALLFLFTNWSAVRGTRADYCGTANGHARARTSPRGPNMEGPPPPPAPITPPTLSQLTYPCKRTPRKFVQKFAVCRACYLYIPKRFVTHHKRSNVHLHNLWRLSVGRLTVPAQPPHPFSDYRRWIGPPRWPEPWSWHGRHQLLHD